MRTAMHKASFFGHSNEIDYLVSLEGDVNAVDAEGDTPLHDASRFGHEEGCTVAVESRGQQRRKKQGWENARGFGLREW